MPRRETPMTLCLLDVLVARTLPPRDRVSSVFFAGNAHDENQPIHLHVADVSICADRCAKEFGNPCQNFCPAAVYEMIDDGAGGKRLQINAANCALFARPS